MDRLKELQTALDLASSPDDLKPLYLRFRLFGVEFGNSLKEKVFMPPKLYSDLCAAIGMMRLENATRKVETTAWFAMYALTRYFNGPRLSVGSAA